MPAWLFGLAITLLVGAAATAYLWLIRRRDDETAAGLLALAGMRWRDFSRLVLEAMELRGLVRVDDINHARVEIFCAGGLFIAGVGSMSGAWELQAHALRSGGGGSAPSGARWRRSWACRRWCWRWGGS